MTALTVAAIALPWLLCAGGWAAWVTAHWLTGGMR